VANPYKSRHSSACEFCTLQSSITIVLGLSNDRCVLMSWPDYVEGFQADRTSAINFLRTVTTAGTPLWLTGISRVL